MYSRAFEKLMCSNFKHKCDGNNKEGSAGEGSTDGDLITYPALFKSRLLTCLGLNISCI